LENFELPVSGHSSVLLIGKNGSGKTSVSYALEILQKIARGANRVKDLVTPDDFKQWLARMLILRPMPSGQVQKYPTHFRLLFSFPAFSFLIAGWLERKMQERKIRGSLGGGISEAVH
jgi:energy-coupling factor transporter ATP-binding protein EcfA2